MTVILAMAGTAIGLGNIWRFPYMLGEYGGFAFVLVYVIATILVSLPVFIAEVIVGRRSRCNARDAFSSLAPGNKFWRVLGVLPVLIPTIIASYYSVIGGWSLEYFIKACSLTFNSLDPSDSAQMFGGFISSTWTPVILHIVFFVLCALVVVGGVRSGIERFSKYTMPVLFVLVLFIAIYSMSLPGSAAGVEYMFKPDFTKMSPRTFAYAMGQSFYSLSLGMGAIITYGSYVKKEENILASSSGTALSDLSFALLAGLAIMPAVFAAGIEPNAGPGLIFQSIPFIFSKMSINMPVTSAITAIMFFLAVVVAAMTSCISLIEVITAYIVERYNISRKWAVAIVTLICGGAGIFCSLSFGPLSALTVSGKSIFDMFDWFASNILLLSMSFLVVVFVGFVMRKEDVRDEFTNSGTISLSNKIFPVVYVLIKWVCPIAVAMIFLTNFIL